MSLARALLARLEAHVPHDDDERRAVETMRAFVASTPEPFTRRTLSGHVTGSAVVLDLQGRALLLHHARLNLWVQPGGHVEEGESPDRAALREATEESGLDDLALDPGPDGAPRLFDVDVHPIPTSEKRGEPAHHHHDACYLARTRRPEDVRHDPDESRAFRWVDAAGAAALPLDPATRRRLAKAFAAR